MIAEVQGVVQRTSSEMPIVNLFGEEFGRMFRDSVHAVGNTAQLYERTVGKYIPRGDRNLPNDASNPGPRYYLLPGFADQMKN